MLGIWVAHIRISYEQLYVVPMLLKDDFTLNIAQFARSIAIDPVWLLVEADTSSTDAAVITRTRARSQGAVWVQQDMSRNAGFRRKILIYVIIAASKVLQLSLRGAKNCHRQFCLRLLQYFKSLHFYTWTVLVKRSIGLVRLDHSSTARRVSK